MKATFQERASSTLAAVVVEVRLSPAASAVWAAERKAAGLMDNLRMRLRTLAVVVAAAARV